MLLAVAEHEDIQSQVIPRVASGFCSGMARSDGLCGAVSGGIMAIGLLLGRDTPEDSLDPCYQAVRLLLDEFSNRYGALNCLELTGVHLGTPAGQADFKEKGQIKMCTNYVGETARMVMEIVESIKQ